MIIHSRDPKCVSFTQYQQPSLLPFRCLAIPALQFFLPHHFPSLCNWYPIISPFPLLLEFHWGCIYLHQPHTKKRILDALNTLRCCCKLNLSSSFLTLCILDGWFDDLICVITINTFPSWKTLKYALYTICMHFYYVILWFDLYIFIKRLV